MASCSGFVVSDVEYVARVAIDICVRKNVRCGVYQMAENKRSFLVRQLAFVQMSQPIGCSPPASDCRVNDHLANHDVWKRVWTNAAHPEVLWIGDQRSTRALRHS